MGTHELAPIRPDQDGELFQLFARIVASGEGFPHAPPLTRAQFDETWVRPVTVVVAATVDGELAGAYYLKPNSPGRAAHIANAGYVVSPEHRGLGHRPGAGRGLHHPGADGRLRRRAVQPRVRVEPGPRALRGARLAGDRPGPRGRRR